MSEEEQELILDSLVVKERRLKKHLACLHVKVRELQDCFRVILPVLRDCNIDFDYVRKTYEPVASTDIGAMISEIEDVCNRLGAVQDDMRKIEHPA